MRKGQEGRELFLCFRGILIGSGTALLLCAALLLAASAGIGQGLLSSGIRRQITVTCCVFGSFAGALLAVKCTPMKGVAVGLSVGGTFFLALLALGVLLYDTVSFENGGLELLGASVCGGAAAGVLGRGRKNKSGTKRRTR